MSRRFRSNDITSAAWRIRMITQPTLPQRTLDSRPEPPAPPPAPALTPAPTALPLVPALPPAPTARPADPLRSLFETLREQTAAALPRIGTHERTQVGDLAARLEALMSAHARGLDTAPMLQPLLQRAGHLARHAGSTAAAVQPTRDDRVLAALQELKLALGPHGLVPGGDPALFQPATELFVRLGRATTRWREAMPDRNAVALLERDEARPLAAEVLAFLRAAHGITVHPVWNVAAPSPDANALFFSGRAGPVADALQQAANQVGLRIEPAAPAGAEGPAERWRSLLRAHVAAFDLSEDAPRVYYELGMALVAGNALVLVAPTDLVLPFDVAQNVTRYSQASDLATLLPQALDSAAYRVQVQAPREAAPVSRARGDRVVVRPRWRPVPQEDTPRWFAVMPFRPNALARWTAMLLPIARAHPEVKAVRGDIAPGQHIIASIWEELCRATHVTVDLSGLNLNVCLEAGIAHALGRRTLFIGEEGTTRSLGVALPELAKWRCHEYGKGSGKRFHDEVRRFFGAG